MTKFVPEHGFPRVRRIWPRGRAIGSDHPAKADTEIPGTPRKAEGANGEIFLIREYFDNRLIVQRKAVLFRDRRVGPLEQRNYIATIDFCLPRIHADIKVLTSQYPEVFNCIPE